MQLLVHDWDCLGVLGPQAFIYLWLELDQW